MKNIITLKDASGTDIEFKMLDQFTHEERTYVVLMPHNESTTQVSIYEVVPTKDEGVDGLLGITPELTNVLFEVFKERNKDKFNFVEEQAIAYSFFWKSLFVHDISNCIHKDNINKKQSYLGVVIYNCYCIIEYGIERGEALSYERREKDEC